MCVCVCVLVSIVYMGEEIKDSSYMIGKIFHFIILLLFFPLLKQS